MKMDAAPDIFEETEPVGFGFVPTVDKKLKHECQFNPFPNTSPYHKHGNTDLAYMTIGCTCGAVKEVVVQDLRTPVNPSVL